jgi:hypothetical protein
VSYGGWRLLRPPERVLDRRRRFGVEAQARLARPADLTPLIIRRPVPGRFVLCRLGRHVLATENRAAAPGSRRVRRRQGDVGAVALIGPSRSGKTRAAIAGIDAWRGPAILSSVKTDLLGATIQTRSARGEIKVFDPSGVTGLDSACWTPLGRARMIGGAQSAARALVDASPEASTTTVLTGETRPRSSSPVFSGSPPTPRDEPSPTSSTGSWARTAPPTRPAAPSPPSSGRSPTAASP